MRSDEDRSGRPRTPGPRQPDIGHAGAPPKKYGVTHWSSRLLAQHLGIGYGTVGCGATTESSPGALRRSNSPPIPDWSQGHRHVGLYLDSPRTRSCFRQPGHELSGLLAVTTHRRRREPRSRMYADQLNESTPTDQHLHAVGGQTLGAGVGDESAGLRDVRADGPTKTCSRCGQTKRMRTTPRSA